ncbi:hypothetical protein [Deinococcus navajonensis]|uniref:Outer membrane protein beta-barrel domain-containing protein n=1 Tax=Deinococcus navajonensis TaxID=309884 RepID=A0ABV8XKZ0_9DEIO
MKHAALLLLLTAPGTAQAAVDWAGADASTTGFGVHAGLALLPLPFVGTLGAEASGERGWTPQSPGRLAAGLTLRDLNLPLTRVDAFATLGAEYRTASSAQSSLLAGYAEAGFRGPLLGPAGWRMFARASTSGQVTAGLGLELRF